MDSELTIPLTAIVAIAGIVILVLGTSVDPASFAVPTYTATNPVSSAGQAITPPETCGNGICRSGETCSSCSQDCGVCPITQSTVQFALGPTFLVLEDSTSDTLFGTATISNEYVEDAELTMRGTTKGTSQFMLSDFTYTLRTDSYNGVDVYVAPGQQFRSEIDEPFGMLGSWDIAFLNFNNTTTQSTVQIQRIAQPYKIVPEFTMTFTALNKPLGLTRTAPLDKTTSPGLLSPSTLGGSTASQQLWLSTVTGDVRFEENNDDEDGYFLFYNGGDPIFTYKLTFTPALLIGSTTSAALLGANLNVLGSGYAVVSATTSSQRTKLSLIEKGVTDTLAEGQTRSYTVNGKKYDITALVVSQKSVKLLVNGEVTDAMAPGMSDTLMDGMQVAAISMKVSTGTLQ